MSCGICDAGVAMAVAVLRNCYYASTDRAIVTFPNASIVQVRCGRKNHSGSQRQVNKKWDRLRQGDSRDLGRHWNQQSRDRPSIASKDSAMSLSSDQAIGHVVSAQANFMRVIVEQVGIYDGMVDVSRTDDAILQQNAAEFDKLYTAETAGNEEGGRKPGTKLLCVVRAVLKKIKRRVIVGDRVLISAIDWVDKRGMIEDVLDRKTEISDPPVANVDHLIVLFALDRPRLDPVILNRFLVEAETTGIPVTVVLNKADLVTEKVKENWENRLAEWGYKPHVCCVDSGVGVKSLAPLLEDRISVVFGPSGVGKSSLINALRTQKDKTIENDSEDEDDIAVNEVSHRSGFGKHTTRHVSLLQLPLKGAMLADTPGFGYPDLKGATSSMLPLLYPEICSRLEDSETGCGFVDCRHISEPNCAVGSDWERHPYYTSLYEELKKREVHERNVFGTKQESDVRYKVKACGVKQAEPMLTMKKHRRISRRNVKQSVDDDIWEQRQENKEIENLKLP